MKKLALPLIAALFFAACQNSTPAPDAAAAKEAQSQTSASGIELSKIKDAGANAKALQQEIKTLLNEVNAAASTLKGQQKEDATALANEINDLIAKEDMMTEIITASEKSGNAEAESITGGSASPETLKDYMESIDRYRTFLGELHTRFDAIKSGGAKKN